MKKIITLASPDENESIKPFDEIHSDLFITDIQMSDLKFCKTDFDPE